MFLNLGGGTQIKAEQLDQVVSPALKLLVALGDTKATEKALKDLIALRDQALEYAGSEKVLRAANKRKEEAERMLDLAVSQSESIKANAAKEAEEYRGKILNLKSQVGNLEAELERIRAETERTVSAANQEAADVKAEANRLIEGANHMRETAERDREKAAALKAQWEEKVAKLKAMVED